MYTDRHDVEGASFTFSTSGQSPEEAKVLSYQPDPIGETMSEEEASLVVRRSRAPYAQRRAGGSRTDSVTGELLD